MIGWLVVGAVGGSYTGKLSDVAKNDESSFLPASAEATEVSELRRQLADSEPIPAIVVAERPGGVNQDDRRFLDRVRGETDEAERALPVLPSTDGEALRLVVPVTAGSEPGDVVERLRDLLEQDRPAGLTVYVTGPAAQAADLSESFRCCPSWFSSRPSSRSVWPA